ncbi:MAG: hypothetical protein QXQ39_01150 [Conexivisphaerales archaeon]
MAGIYSLLNSGVPVLIVELPANDIELAKAVSDAGADSVIAQLHHEHPVTHSYTGGLELEKNILAEIRKEIAIPLGLHIGNQARLNKREWEELQSLDVDYLCTSLANTPPYMLADRKLAKILCVGTGIPVEHYRAFATFPALAALLFEPLSQLHPDPQVKFNVLDIVNMDTLVRVSPLPILFRVSQDVEHEDIQLMIERGCRGIVLDPGYSGSTVEHYKLTTEAYHKAIKAYSKKSTFMGYGLWG